MKAFDWYRHSVVDQFLIAGPTRFLNVGTGGGVETLRLLRKGNHVTTIEVNAETAARTSARIRRCGYSHRHDGHVGHVLGVPVQGPFDGILMCEVLEHIKEDFRVLQRLSQWLAPGGRLILSTPTASFGQLPGDYVSLHEDGGHVRVGYDGPELDAMLADVGMIPLRRTYVGHRFVRAQIRIDRFLQTRCPISAVSLAFSFASRPCIRWLDMLPGRPLCQLTLAVKRHQRPTPGM
jgi:SAM-dependent methyltransferase